MPIIYCYVVEEKYISVMQKIHIMGYSESESEKSVSYSTVSLYSSSLSKASAPSSVSVSVSENLVSEKKSRFRFQNFWSRKKVSVSVSEKFGLGKKSRFRFRKIWYRKKSLGFGQNFGIVIQCLCVSASHRFCVCG